MRTLDRDLRVYEIARRVGAAIGEGAVESILNFCRQRVAGWTGQRGGLGSVQELEALVCARLNLEFQEFRHESGLEAIVGRQVAAGDVVFASLPALFDDETFATLIRCRRQAPDGSQKYLAVIDCRGRKASRRWFSRWHEIAHLLTLDAPSEAQPVHRSTSERSAVERLMDLIAADIGFYEPLFAPVFSAEVLAAGRLSFAAIDRVRQRYAPEASFQATAIACVKRWPRPAVHLEAGLALTAAEAKQFEQETVPARRPTPRLRVLKAIGNAASHEAGLELVRQMQVPEASLLHALFFARDLNFPHAEMSAVEDLGQWTRSNGRHLACCPVAVEARPGRHYVEALVQAI